MARDPGNHFARVIVIDGKSGHKIKEKTWAMMAKKKGLSGFPNAILGPFGVFRE